MVECLFTLVGEAEKATSQQGLTLGAWVMFFIGTMILGGGQIASLLIAFKKRKKKDEMETSKTK